MYLHSTQSIYVIHVIHKQVLIYWNAAQYQISCASTLRRQPSTKAVGNMNEADQEKVRGYLTTKQIECNVSASFNQVTKMCGPIFDGILCWNATPPGMVATQRCPFNHLIVSQHEVRSLASNEGDFKIKISEDVG